MITAEQKAQMAKLVERATEMVPALRARTDETAQLGRLPDATIQEMQEAGFFKIMQPKRYGGLELPPHAFFDVQMKLAEGCMSTAWVLGVVAIHNWQMGLYPDQAQQDVWGEDNSTLISSSYMPVGKVQRVEGGFMLSGKWGFSSGSMHCQWAFLGAVVPPEKEGDDAVYSTFLVPRGDYEIVENWDVSGLEGTGSHDILIKEPVFVPAHRLHSLVDAFNINNPGQEVNTSSVFRLPFGQIFPRAVSSSSIGALQGALNAFIAVNRERVGLNDGAQVVLDPQAQFAAANAAGVIDECRTILFRNFDQLMEYAENNEVPPMEVRTKMRYDASAVSKKCADAMNDLFINCGAQGIFRTHPINRYFLDINAGRTHVANNLYKLGRNYGGEMMGIPNGDTFL